MAIHDRSFDEMRGDFAAMWRLLDADFAHRRDDYVWHVSRLGDWKHGLWNEKKLFPTFFRDYTHLWLDAFDTLLGFVLSENADEVFFIVTRPGYDYLYADILDWTIRHWMPRFGKLTTEVHEGQQHALAELERRGFGTSGVAATTRVYDLSATSPAPAELPEGYQIVDMAQNGDYRAKAVLNLDGFSNRDDLTEFDLLRYAYSRENPAYDARLDLSVVTPNGLHVSSCVGFADPAHGVVEVEKIVTHRQYRRMGLAEAAVRECFRRVARMGITRAYITGYSVEANGLYEKLGPIKYKRWYHYSLTP
ncbi:MAG: GNAT family N-acetyltransferase [Chloroflexi bacterium]|nr:GNAT family N-acetyltransferase [Chloroflexota bacterium]